MPALVKLVPVKQVRPEGLSPFPWRTKNLPQDRDRTIELIVPAGLAAMIDEYAIFGPQLGDRLPSFPGVSLAEHLMEIALEQGRYRVRHGFLACIR